MKSKLRPHNELLFRLAIRDLDKSLAGKPSSYVRVTLPIPATKKKWLDRELEGMGIRDHAAFFRGVLIAAVGNARRSQDPRWQKFLEEVEPIAVKYFGAGLTMGEPSDYELQGGAGGAVPLKEARRQHRSRKDG